MKFSSIQPYLVLITCVITCSVTIYGLYLTYNYNQKIESLKSNLQIEVIKKTEPLKLLLNKDLEELKSRLQVDVVTQTEPFKASLNKEVEGLKSGFQLDIIRETEPLKAALNKNNIAYQIHTAEYIKMRFLKTNELFSSILSLHELFA